VGKAPLPIFDFFALIAKTFFVVTVFVILAFDLGTARGGRRIYTFGRAAPRSIFACSTNCVGSPSWSA
jgi:hypothetical protein